MSNVNALLSQRLKKGEQSSKMAEMAKQSACGGLTSFSGVFSVSELNVDEKLLLEELLKSYAIHEENISADLQHLTSITAEVKAITNQAVLLHGERIKRAHSILTRYRDGAFTAWMLAAYGNRQTPYNLMQYYDFHEALPKLLHTKLEAMPRQAVYTLAARKGDFEKKRLIVENYQGESKEELLQFIREQFPLDADDKRLQNPGEGLVNQLRKMYVTFQRQSTPLDKSQKKEIMEWIEQLKELVEA
jgi:hypothetical protein